MPRMSGRDMPESGSWVKLGAKHYQHINGRQIRYNHNKWHWDVLDDEGGFIAAYDALWVARLEVERDTA